MRVLLLLVPQMHFLPVLRIQISRFLWLDRCCLVCVTRFHFLPVLAVLHSSVLVLPRRWLVFSVARRQFTFSDFHTRVVTAGFLRFSYRAAIFWWYLTASWIILDLILSALVFLAVHSRFSYLHTVIRIFLATGVGFRRILWWRARLWTLLATGFSFSQFLWRKARLWILGIHLRTPV